MIEVKTISQELKTIVSINIGLYRHHKKLCHQLLNQFNFTCTKNSEQSEDGLSIGQLKHELWSFKAQTQYTLAYHTTIQHQYVSVYWQKRVNSLSRHCIAYITHSVYLKYSIWYTIPSCIYMCRYGMEYFEIFN